MTEIGTSAQHARPATGRLGLFHRRRDRSANHWQQSVDTPSSNCGNSARNTSFRQRTTENVASTPSSTRARPSSSSVPATGSTSAGNTTPTQTGNGTVTIPNSTVETFCSYLIPSSSNDGQTITHFFATRQRSDLSWTLSETEQRAYAYVFDAWDETRSSTHVPGNKAVKIFDRAELNREILAKIWDIVDSDDQGELSVEGFVISLALIIRRLHGISIPEELPAEMLPTEDLTSYLDRRPPSPTQSLDLVDLSESSQSAVDLVPPVIPPIQRTHYENGGGERHPDTPPPVPPRPPELRQSLATMMEFPFPSYSSADTPSLSSRGLPNPWGDESSVDTFAWGRGPSSRSESPIRSLSPLPLQSEQLAIQLTGPQATRETALGGATVSPPNIPTEAPPPYSASESVPCETPLEAVAPSNSATRESTTSTDPPPTRPPPRAVSPLRPRRRSSLQAEAGLAEHIAAQSSSEASSSVIAPVAQHDDPDSPSTLAIHQSDQQENQNNNDPTEPLSPRRLPKPKRPAPKAPSRSQPIATPAGDVGNQPMLTDKAYVLMAQPEVSQPTSLSTAINPFESDSTQEQGSSGPVKPSLPYRPPKPRRPPPSIPVRLPKVNPFDNLADQPPPSEASDSTTAATSENQLNIEDNLPSTAVNPFESLADEQGDQGSASPTVPLSPRRPPKPPRPPPRVPPAIPARPPSLALHRSKSSPVPRVSSPVSVSAPSSSSASAEKTSPLAGELPSREADSSAFASAKSDLSTSVVSLPKDTDKPLSPRRSSEQRRPPPIAPRPVSLADHRAKTSPDAVIPLSALLETGLPSPPRVLRSPSNASGEMDLSPFITAQPASEDPSIPSIDSLESLMTQEPKVAVQPGGSDFDRPVVMSPATVVASPEQDHEHESVPDPEREQATEIQTHHTLPTGSTTNILSPVLRPSISNTDLSSSRAASAPLSASTPPLSPADADAPKTPLTPASPSRQGVSEQATISIVDPLDELPSSLSHILTEAMRSMSTGGSDSDVAGKPRLHNPHGSRRYSIKHFRAVSSPSIMDVVPSGEAVAHHDDAASRGDWRGKRRTLADTGWRRKTTMVVDEGGEGRDSAIADTEEHPERDGGGPESSWTIPTMGHQRTVSMPALAFANIVEDEGPRQDNAEEQAEEAEAEADQNGDTHSHDDLQTVDEFGQPTFESHSSRAEPPLSGMSTLPSLGASSTMPSSSSGSHRFSRSLSMRMQRSISALAPHSRNQYCDDYKEKRDEGNHDLTMREYKWRKSYVGKVSRKISTII